MVDTKEKEAREQMLMMLLQFAEQRNTAAAILQDYVASFGLLPDDLGDTVRKILEEKKR